MAVAGKDSPEVVRFMTLFAHLKDYCDDRPDVLYEDAARDSSVQTLCGEVTSAAFPFRWNEQRSRTLFIDPVDPVFIAAWRDYELRYEHALSEVWTIDLWQGLGIDPTSHTPTSDPGHAAKWENVDDEAAEKARGIKDAIEFAKWNAEQDHRWDDDNEDLPKRILKGVAAWDSLEESTGFDLQGVFRRRTLVPFVLIPRQVAKRYGTAETPSMLTNLQQANDAFVFGAIYGAIALMRSILEAVLRDHYNATGNDLTERIRNARDRLPRAANAERLHKIRLLANAVLHLDPGKSEGLAKMDELELEKEIISLLFVLRALIEGAR